MANNRKEKIMPTVRKVAEEDFRTVGIRAATQREYDAYLSEFGPGDVSL